eukprot:scaffold1258_cov272-Prasinococcus_capsulatus_cf.AAC.1
MLLHEMLCLPKWREYAPASSRAPAHLRLLARPLACELARWREGSLRGLVRARREPITVQFTSTKYSAHRTSCCRLPEQMRAAVAPLGAIDLERWRVPKSEAYTTDDDDGGDDDDDDDDDPADAHAQVVSSPTADETGRRACCLGARVTRRAGSLPCLQAGSESSASGDEEEAAEAEGGAARDSAVESECALCGGALYEDWMVCSYSSQAPLVLPPRLNAQTTASLRARRAVLRRLLSEGRSRRARVRGAEACARRARLVCRRGSGGGARAAPTRTCSAW